jgi:beta-lactamase class A
MFTVLRLFLVMICLTAVVGAVPARLSAAGAGATQCRAPSSTGCGQASSALANGSSERPELVALSERAPRNRLAWQLERLVEEAPGRVAIAIADLRTGYALSINGDVSVPAASTIKIPIMVEVMRQATLHRFSLQRTVTLTDADRDCGYGSLCDAPSGSAYTVRELLWRMITRSDNTAANMLIRLVGRGNINQTMQGLGLDHTWLGDSIRSDGDIRSLRTTANDMMHLLIMIARRQVVTASACRQMLAILAAQRHNTMIPAWLPKHLVIAHKTGTLHDTLNDVGIVELRGSPYVLCVFTTHLDDLDAGERFVRRVSLVTYRAFRWHRGDLY